MQNLKQSRITPRHQQQGVSLIIVLVCMLLSLLLVMGSTRLSLLNEKMASNSTDYQRTYEAAEALLADAELDLACMIGGCTTRDTKTQFECKQDSYDDLVDDFTALALTPPCRDGICLDLGTAVSGNPATSFWNSATNGSSLTWETMTSDDRGAKYGQYTNTSISSTDAVNPLLSGDARYWIEIIRYGSADGGTESYASKVTQSGGSFRAPDSNCSFMFRITVAAKGRKTGTTAVLQTVHKFNAPP